MQGTCIKIKKKLNTFISKNQMLSFQKFKFEDIDTQWCWCCLQRHGRSDIFR